MANWRQLSRKKAKKTQVEVARDRWNLNNHERLEEENVNRFYTPKQR